MKTIIADGIWDFGFSEEVKLSGTLTVFRKKKILYPPSKSLIPATPSGAAANFNKITLLPFVFFMERK